MNPVGALLAVPDPILRTVTPCFLTEAIHHRVKVPIFHLEQVIDVIKYLNISIQVYHLAVLYKLQIEPTCQIPNSTKINIYI